MNDPVTFTREDWLFHAKQLLPACTQEFLEWLYEDMMQGRE